MAKLKAKVGRSSTPQNREVCTVICEGIISTPTVSHFREVMAKPNASGRDVLLDLSKITYINSSGLGELVRINDDLARQNLSLLIVNSDPEVGRLILMLGLQSVLHVFRTPAAAMEALDSGLTERAGDLPAQAESKARKQMRGGAFVPVVATPEPRLPDARILIGVNGDVHFARFLGRCLSGHGGNALVVGDLTGVKQVADQGRIDIAIIDSTLPDAQEICAELKMRTENGILSIIFIYPDEEERKPAAYYRVCEDEYVVEPFEVREMVALAQAEYSRCKSESILFVQEACFELATRDDAIGDVCEKIEGMLHESGLPQEPADGYFYAIREAIDNARRHGNLSDSSKLIEVLYVLDKEKITVTVGDEGDGFDWTVQIERAKSTSPIEQARVRHSSGGYGGLGIGLMLRCTDKLEYLPPGNIVKLTKYL